MKFQFTKKEEELLIIFLLLYQYKNRALGFFKNCYHPIVLKTLRESKTIDVPKELIKPLKNYHPCYFATWFYGGEDYILTKYQTQLLKKLVKKENLYDLMKISEKGLKKIISKEEKKWKNGLTILKSAIKKLPFSQPVKLILNLFDGFGTGYGIKSKREGGFIIVGPHRDPLSDQTILHEYMHIIFNDWFRSNRGKKNISLILKGPLKNKWQIAKRPWYQKKETIAEEYFLRTLTLRFLPENLKSAFIKEQNNQGFKDINKLSKCLLKSGFYEGV